MKLSLEHVFRVHSMGRCHRPGRATAVYMNSLFLGGMIGSVSMGFIASAADFKTVLFVAAGASLAAFTILLATWKVQPRPHAQEL